MGLTIPSKCVTFRDYRANRSGEIRKKVGGGGGFFGRFSNFDNSRPELAGNIISGAAVNKVSMDVRAKFGDSRLNRG